MTEITPPAGWQPPQTDSPSGEFDIVCTFKPTPEGRLLMVKLGDADVSGGEARDYKPSYESKAREIAGAMGEAMAD